MTPRPDHARTLREALSDPLQLCEDLGLLQGRRSYQRQARGLLVRCPWHDERTPSCSVRTGEDGTVAVRCHGCGATGDALSLVAAVHRLDLKLGFREVLTIASELAGLRLEPGNAPRYALPPVRPAPPPEGPPPLASEDFDGLTRWLATRCPLDRNPEAVAYLEGRGLRRVVGNSWFSLPGGTEALARLREALVRDFGAATWERSGLDRGDRWAFPEHSLCIPWRSYGPGGHVLTLQRRVLRPPRDPKVPRYVFPRGRQARTLYGVGEAQELTGPETALAYVEGAPDTMAARELYRRENLDRVAVGLPGVAGWRREFAELARGRVALIAFDADAAGEAAVERVAADLYAAGATRVQRSTPATGKDWAELAEGAA